MALSHPTKLSADEIHMRDVRLTIHCCTERVAAIASEIASRIHIEMTHRSSMVDENVSSFSMSCLSLPSTDENAACATQNRQAYWTSSGITRSKVFLDTEDTASVGFKIFLLSFDIRLLK